MKIIMDISDRILALNQGKRIAFDTPKNISQNTQVINAYLGTIDVA
jgi:branched-chain amino acid transport system ATP-binding protein